MIVDDGQNCFDLMLLCPKNNRSVTAGGKKIKGDESGINPSVPATLLNAFVFDFPHFVHIYHSGTYLITLTTCFFHPAHHLQVYTVSSHTLTSRVPFLNHLTA